MDVPFFLYGGTALAVSRGDEVYPLAGPDDLPIVLILPDFSISTADAYGNLRLTNSEADLTLQHFSWNLPEVRLGLRELVNDLESAAGERFSSIQEYKRLLLDLGASSSMMSGSGSSVFGIFHDEASARDAARSLGLRGIEAVATKTVGGRAYRAERLKQLASFGQRSKRGGERALKFFAAPSIRASSAIRATREGELHGNHRGSDIPRRRRKTEGIRLHHPRRLLRHQRHQDHSRPEGTLRLDAEQEAQGRDVSGTSPIR